MYRADSRCSAVDPFLTLIFLSRAKSPLALHWKLQICCMSNEDGGETAKSRMKLDKFALILDNTIVMKKSDGSNSQMKS
jgi:hypothetical protein